MNELIELLVSDIKSTIEGLIGTAPEVNILNHSTSTGETTPPYIKINAKVNPKGEIVFLSLQNLLRLLLI